MRFRDLSQDEIGSGVTYLSLRLRAPSRICWLALKEERGRPFRSINAPLSRGIGSSMSKPYAA